MKEKYQKATIHSHKEFANKEKKEQRIGKYIWLLLFIFDVSLVSGIPACSQELNISVKANKIIKMVKILFFIIFLLY